nr:MAG TPA: hypothetical protein [Caudoviricetes sp.]
MEIPRLPTIAILTFSIVAKVWLFFILCKKNVVFVSFDITNLIVTFET